MDVAKDAGARRRCPDCGKLVPVDPGFRPWCECGWNLDAREDPARPSLVSRVFRDATRREGDALLRELLHTGPRGGASPAGGWMLLVASSPVLLAWLLLPVAAVALAVRLPGDPFAWLGVVILCLLAWFLRPRTRRARAEATAPEDRYPTLHDLTREVCGRLSATPPARVEIDGEYRTAAARVGRSRRRTLLLGLPMFAALAAEERVALLAHAIARFECRDRWRLRFPRAALGMLEGWCEVLTPSSLTAEHPDEGLNGFLARTLLAGVALLPHACLRVLARLAWAPFQRAEYEADLRGAEVAGTAPLVRLLGDLDEVCFEQALHRVVVGGSDRDVVAEYRHQLRHRPARELERLRRLADRAEPAPGSLQPPRGSRTRLLTEPPAHFPAVRLDPGRNAALDRELAAAIPRVHARLVARHESRLCRFEDPRGSS